MDEGTVILAATVVAVTVAGAVVGGLVLEPVVGLGEGANATGPDGEAPSGDVPASGDDDTTYRLAPGVDADGIDAARLAQAHATSTEDPRETTVTVVRRDASGAPFENETLRDDDAVRTALERYLRAGAFTVEETTREDGRPVVHLVADEPGEDAADALGVASVVRLHGTATVTQDGRVLTLELRLTYTNHEGDRIGMTAIVETSDE